MRIPLLTALLWASPAFAGEVSLFEVDDFTGFDIIIVGEIHDSPEHHLLQAEIIAMVDPTAVVFEMLNSEQAALITQANLPDPKLGEILGWEAAGWPDFAMYAPIFAAIDDAIVFGAAASDFAALQAREDIVRAFPEGADRFGLTDVLPNDEQMLREQEMQDGHCGALPPEMLPWFVDQQRFRDAVFARAALNALDVTDGPIVVITGNGHARTDWGMPIYLKAAAPDVTVLSIGQITMPQDGAPFDLWRVTDPIERPDPCADFK
jgi:uncharacterized iron-regulated protein